MAESSAMAHHTGANAYYQDVEVGKSEATKDASENNNILSAPHDKATAEADVIVKHETPFAVAGNPDTAPEVVQATSSTTITNADAAHKKTEDPALDSFEQTKESENVFINDTEAQGYSSPRSASSDPDTLLSPYNLPTWRKLSITASLCLIGFLLGFKSSINSSVVGILIRTYRLVNPLGLLSVSIFLKGWSFGTAFFGPLITIFGRQYPMYGGLFLFIIFQIPVAVAENIQTIIVCRFFTGFFGSVPLFLVWVIFRDIWGTGKRLDLVMNAFVTSLLIGAAIGPIAGAYLVADRERGWRWVEYTTIIVSVPICLTALVIPETSRHILQRRQSKGLKSKEDIERTSAKRLIDVWLNRPFIMLFTDPVLFLMSLHSALAIGVLYISFETFMLPFMQLRRWQTDRATLPPYIILFLGVVCGSVLITVFITSYLTHKRSTRKFKPEQRLLPIIIGSPFLPAGLFWFAWTNDRTLHWLGQAASMLFVGFGIIPILQQGEAYTMEIYAGTKWQESAMVGMIFLRSLFAAGFTMASRPMYERVHVPWATSAWGFIMMACILIPVVLYFYGEKMRAKGRYTKQT